MSSAKPGKALVTVSRALTAGVRKYGRAILCSLAMSLKTARLYSTSHQNVTLAMDELEDFVMSFIRLETKCRISRAGDSLFLNDILIKVDFGSYDSFHHVLSALAERDIGLVELTQGLDRKELEALVSILNAAPPAPENAWEAFEASLRPHRLPHVAFTRHRDQNELESGGRDARKAVLNVYFQAISAMDAVLAQAREGQAMSLKRVRHAIQDIVDLTLEKENLLLSLVNLKDCGAPGSSHAVNVAILAVALGAKLELSKKLLGDLGFAGMLHDVGRAKLPPHLQNPCLADLSDEEREQDKSHVYKGVKLLLGENMADATVKCVNVAFLHHYRHDRTGYPRLLVEKEQNLYTRIVAVASHYDDATAPNRLTREPQDPETVLRGILEGSGTEFDPLVVKAFINLMGLYPFGCMVRLDTGEIATVVAAPRSPKFLDRPIVKLLGDESGRERTEVCDLLDRAEDGRFRRTIVKLYQQKEVNLELEEYLGVI